MFERCFLCVRISSKNIQFCFSTHIHHSVLHSISRSLDVRKSKFMAENIFHKCLRFWPAPRANTKRSPFAFRKYWSNSETDGYEMQCDCFWSARDTLNKSSQTYFTEERSDGDTMYSNCSIYTMKRMSQFILLLKHLQWKCASTGCRLGAQGGRGWVPNENEKKIYKIRLIIIKWQRWWWWFDSYDALHHAQHQSCH